MEKSIIYNLLADTLLSSWEEAIEKEDSCSFKKEENEIKKKIDALIPDEHKELVNKYVFSVVNNIDYIQYNIRVKMLNLGIHIGMELQKAFARHGEE